MSSIGLRTEDPRPIGDKAHTNKEVKKLIFYLTSHQYDNPISPNMLTRPQQRDFNNIVQVCDVRTPSRAAPPPRPPAPPLTARPPLARSSSSASWTRTTRRASRTRW